jgi:hypothetical protein
MEVKTRRKLSKDAEYVLDLLVAAGHITRETACQAKDIALDLPPEQVAQYVSELDALVLARKGAE